MNVEQRSSSGTPLRQRSSARRAPFLASARECSGQLPHGRFKRLDRSEVYEASGETRQTGAVWCPVRPRRTLPVLNIWHRPRKEVNRELHALNGNASSLASAPVLPVQELALPSPRHRMRIHQKRSLDVVHATRQRCGHVRKGTVGERKHFDELDGAETLKGAPGKRSFHVPPQGLDPHLKPGGSVSFLPFGFV